MEGAPLVANQIDLFMHFLGASCDGLVARRVDLDTISSSVNKLGYNRGTKIFRAVEAMKAKEKETAAKANNSIAKTKE